MPRTAPAPSSRPGLATYRGRRDFTATPEPSPAPRRGQRVVPKGAHIFVVQKHAARRLHWDFRLEQDGVLWSWAVPKGPSLDPADKRLAVHVEDHPLDYAEFEGRIPEGHYGAGTVEIWDHGTWQPVGDPHEGIARGELKFTLAGDRLSGGFVLVRLKPRPKDHAENWLLIKEHDGTEEPGEDAPALEARPAPRKAHAKPEQADAPPAEGAIRGALPARLAPQLASSAEATPSTGIWGAELKFDGYRIFARKDRDEVRLLTRTGLDWTARLPKLAAAIAALKPAQLLLDGELVALRRDGVSSFADLQAAFSAGSEARMVYFAFDLLHLDGWDLRPCRLDARKLVLEGLAPWKGRLRFSEHLMEDPARVRQHACAMGLEGIVCKRLDRPYRAGRGTDWLKLKCAGRDEFVVLGYTPPHGSRTGLGALHLGFHDPQGRLHYAGGVGTGFDARMLDALRARLGKLHAPPPPGLLLAGDPPERSITWVKPDLVGEVRYAGWSGSGRLRHASWLGLREDKSESEVMMPIPDPQAERRALDAKPKRPAILSPRRAAPADGPALTHADRELWPGITKQDLAEYWARVAEAALPEIGHRPLALVRCPEGIGGEHFFQKHRSQGMPPQIREGASGSAPYVAIDDAAGLRALAQMSAIELHAWGATEEDATHPDRLVFDLDPGEGTPFSAIIEAAHEVRKRLNQAGLEAFCRTSGGKGLHVVAPLARGADWTAARSWSRDLARAMEREAPGTFVSTLPKKQRKGRILVDWLRNGLGSTAIASFSPRARPGATVATRLNWREVASGLDPAAFTIRTVPGRLKRRDPWAGFAAAARPLPGEL